MPRLPDDQNPRGVARKLSRVHDRRMPRTHDPELLYRCVAEGSGPWQVGDYVVVTPTDGKCMVLVLPDIGEPYQYDALIYPYVARDWADRCLRPLLTLPRDRAPRLLHGHERRVPRRSRREGALGA